MEYNSNLAQRRPFWDKLAKWVTLAFIVLAPFENIRRTEQYIYIIGVGLLAICVFMRRTVMRNNSGTWLFYLLYSFIACAWSVNPNAFSGMFIVTAEILFLILQLQFEYDRTDHENIKIAFIIQCWILLALCMTSGSYMDSRFWLKSASSGADPNYLSGWFIIPLCFDVEYLLSSKTKLIVKLTMILQIVLSFYFIMQTASKSGLIANTAAVIIAGVFAVKEIAKRHPIRAGLLTALMIVAVVFALDHMPAYLLSRLADGVGSMTGRVPMWRTLWHKFVNNPFGAVLGFGSGSVSYYTGTDLVAHNTFLDILCNQGLIGLVPLLVFMFGHMKEKWESRPYAVIALFAMSVLIFTLSAFNTRFFFLMMFLIGANIDYAEQEETVGDESVQDVR